MNTAPYQNPHHESSTFAVPRVSDDIRRLMTSAHATIEQPPPPSLREILTAYRTKGDGDRDMLLSMLNAKTAEDQRLSSLASLHRTMLEFHQQASPILESNHRCLPPSDGAYSYPAPASYAAYPPFEDHKSSHHSHRRAPSRSRSPSGIHTQNDPLRHAPERPSKRRRSSRSPYSTHTGVYESSHASEQYPLSPYSSSERSDTAEYSPRSKSSMTIGNLLSTRPSREVAGDTSRDRR